MVLPYHSGELAVQARTGEFDRAVAHAAAIRSVIPPPLARFLTTQRWIMLGAADAEGRMWATVLHGEAGFAAAADERTVRISGVPGTGDPLAAIAESAGTDAALLAIDLERRLRARMNGRLERDRGGLTLFAEQVYSNCMKYIQRRSPMPDAAASAADPVVEHDDRLSNRDRALLARVDTCFIATVGAGGGEGHPGADVSHRGGYPGFIEPVASRELRFADYPGNSMFNTLGNLELDSRAGLLLPDLDAGDLLQLSGHAWVDYDLEPLDRHPGARRVVTMTADHVVRRAAAIPLRFGAPEYSPFLPSRAGSG